MHTYYWYRPFFCSNVNSQVPFPQIHHVVFSYMSKVDYASLSCSI